MVCRGFAGFDVEASEKGVKLALLVGDRYLSWVLVVSLLSYCPLLMGVRSQGGALRPTPSGSGAG